MSSYYYQRGIAFYNTQQFEEVINIYSIGISKFTNNSMTLSFRGNAYFAIKNYAEALGDYYESIENKENLAIDIEANQKHTQPINEPIQIYVDVFIASMQIIITESEFALGNSNEALVGKTMELKLLPT